jgi:hypothetical protein
LARGLARRRLQRGRLLMVHVLLRLGPLPPEDASKLLDYTAASGAPLPPRLCGATASGRRRPPGPLTLRPCTARHSRTAWPP